MTSDRTKTDSLLSPERARGLLPVLHLVHHADARRIGQRQIVPQEGSLLLGRSQPWFSAGALDERRISRRHAELRWRDGVLELRDVGSHNGSFVNGRQVERARLEPGDVLGIGGLLLLFQLGRPGEPHAVCPSIVGRSDGMAEVLDQVSLAARRDTTVLLLGETGVGKELVAREVHRQSGRKGPFVPVNCGGVSPGLLQSELFGHARGAFSGAERARKGLVVAAEGGTLFLDEIGEASPELQVVFLRLLQERQIRPVGADRPQSVDVRFVAATNRELTAEAEAGRFRGDLLSRLYRWVVRIPPLRERREDIPLLVAHFVEQFAGRALPLRRSLALQLLRHDWPGNVRELEAIVERLVVARGHAPSLDLPLWLPDALSQTSPRSLPAASAPSAASPPARPQRPPGDVLREKLVALGGNVRALATELGVSRNSLYRWLREEGIDPQSCRGR